VAAKIYGRGASAQSQPAGSFYAAVDHNPTGNDPERFMVLKKIHGTH